MSEDDRSAARLLYNILGAILAVACVAIGGFMLTMGGGLWR